MGILPERPLRVSEPFFAARRKRLLILELALALLSIGCAVAAVSLGGFETYRRQMGRERALREVALDGEEVLFPLLSVSRYRQTWTVRYERTPGFSVNAHEPAPPLITLRDGKQYLVALRSPRGGDPVLLPEDLRMFEMSATDRAATLVRAATH